MARASGTYLELEGRGVLRLSGEDRIPFLQGLISNDVTLARPGHALYACLLTPQGKFLHDFFVVATQDALLIECEKARRVDLLDRLRRFKLRSRVELADVSDEYAVFAMIGGSVSAPADSLSYPDPRAPELGSRALVRRPGAGQGLGDLGSSPARLEEYERLRIMAAVPDGSRDMEPGKAILLESNIDLLNGISWEKGCYMGQELTARTRYRGLVKKRLIPVQISGAIPAPGAPLVENGREVGEMRTSVGNVGLALLRLDRVAENDDIVTEAARLKPIPPPRLAPVLAQAADG